MTVNAIEVLKPGLETSLQDFPGRLGYWNQGFPPSGPMDSWSFRMANILVGNAPGDVALECQYLGPTLKFYRDAVIAVTGGDMTPKVDGEVVPLWQSLVVKSGQVLELAGALSGARSYIAVGGGLDVSPVLGSSSTFVKAEIGGIAGRSLRAGDVLHYKDAPAHSGYEVPKDLRPILQTNGQWEIEVCRGPNDDWIDEEGHNRFLSSPWRLSVKSDRTGYRLDGPEWTFTDKAIHKPKEHGSLPSNIIDQGYPMGAINLAGQTPIILVNDGPSMGGFINPYTVPSAAFWKLGQSKPRDVFHFKVVTVETAQAMAATITAACTPVNLVRL